MSFFGIGKKNNNEINKEKNITAFSSQLKELREEKIKDNIFDEFGSKTELFANIQGKTEEKKDISIEDEISKNIVQNIFNFVKLDEKKDTNIDQDKDNFTLEFPLKKDNEKIFEQNEPKTNLLSSTLSEIASISTTRSLEKVDNLDCKFLLEGERIFVLDSMATDLDLLNLITNNLDIKYLDVSNCINITDFAPISQLKNLMQLDISGCEQITNLIFLSSLTKLEVLNAAELSIENLIGLENLTNLKILNLSFCTKIRDLWQIKNCSQLTDLTLWGSTNILHINEISYLISLQSLDLDGCYLIKDLSPISKLTNICYLNLNFTRIEDLSALSNLINLEIFTMIFCPVVLTEENLVYFENLTNMKFLCLNNRAIKNLHYFRKMEKLIQLELNGNLINDLSPIENLTELEILNLSTNTGLNDLSSLKNMKKLKKLNIGGAKAGKDTVISMNIEDISVVKELTSLEVLEASFNKKLRDISSLQYCKNLSEVNLNDCLGISDVTMLRFCPNLKSLQLENCVQIRDLTFLKRLKKISSINISKTSVDRMFISTLTTNQSFSDVKDVESTVQAIKTMFDSLKFRRKFLKNMSKFFNNK